MDNDGKKSTPEVMSTVNLLRKLNLMPLPISRGSKVTYCKKFPEPSFVSPYKDWENKDLGVGLVLSERYKTVDIDIDDPRIADLSVAHLPQGGWIFGRKSKKRSHHVFRLSDVTNTTQKQRAVDPRQKGYMDTEKVHGLGIDGKPRPTIIEYRGDGQQTVMPGTLHESTGELIEWDGGRVPEDLPAAVDSYELRRAVRKIGFTVIVADYAWMEGLRHDVTLCLAGMMATAKWTEGEVEHWFKALMDFTGQGERKNIITCVRSTFKAFKDGRMMVGGPRLTEITSQPGIVTEFRRLFCDDKESILEDMNGRYALGVYFSKLQVFDFNVIDDLSLPDFETMPTTDFQMLMGNEHVKVPGGKAGDRYISKAKFWLEHPKRRTYRVTDFMPGMGLEVGHKLNLWRGWAVKPSSAGSIDCWLDHLMTYICNNDEAMRDWIISWLADIVQNPMDKPGTAIMMRSGTRSGKNTFIEMMKKVIGVRYCREMNSSGQITNRFNSHFQFAMLVFANEADFASSSAATNVLKTLITDRDFHMDHKHGHAKTGHNYTRVVLASNKLHVIARDYDDQRYTVVDVANPSSVLNPEARVDHFNNIYKEINGTGPARLLDFLMNHKYNKSDLRSCYQSEAGRKQTLMSMDPVAQWWAKVVSDGRIRVPEEYSDRIQYRDNAALGWPKSVGKAAIETSFREQHKGHVAIPSAAFFGYLYAASGLSNKDTRQVGTGNNRYRALTIPPLDVVKQKLNSIYPGAIEDGEPITEEQFSLDNLERVDEMEEF